MSLEHTPRIDFKQGVYGSRRSAGDPLGQVLWQFTGAVLWARSVLNKGELGKFGEFFSFVEA